MKNQLAQKFLLITAVAAVLACQAHAITSTALVNNGGTLQLLSFDSATPGTVGSALTISGLISGDTLVGLDYRPVDAVLVGLGYNSATGAAHVYSLSTLTGAATSINGNTLTLGTGLTRVTMDFNPTANAIRSVNSGATANNLRITAAGTGTLVTDGDLNPANPGIRAIAYSRNNPGGGTSGATTLYEIDGTNNALVNQGSIDFFTGSGTSPNTGTQNSVGILTGVTGSTVVGFDIFTATGTAASTPGSAFLATGAGGFLSLNLSTAAASSIGTIGGTYTSVLDVALVPEPGCAALLSLTVTGLAARRNRRQTAAV